MTANNQTSLEGWEAVPGPDLSLERIIDLAFDYRGDVTITMADGSRVVGYLFNRNRDVPQPFVQLFEASGSRPTTIRYSDIRGVRFSGKDMAAGNSYEAWTRHQEAQAQPPNGA